MALLSKDAIFAVDDLVTEEVPVPEWGGSVLLRTMTGKERDAFENSFRVVRNGKTKENFANFRARMIAAVVVDEVGNKLFGTPADVDALGRKSVKPLQALFNKAQEMNGLSDKDVEDLTEDFGETPDESLSTG